MKKGKIFVVGLIALMMTGGLILIGCEEQGGCQRNGECYYNSNTGEFSLCADSSCAAIRARNQTNSGEPTNGFCDCE
jgi:hypothetical protein